MDRKTVVKKLIHVLADYYEKQKSFRKVFSKDPVLSKAIEVFDSTMDEMIDNVLVSIGVPEEEPENKYQVANWKRYVCKGLILKAAKERKYVTSATDIIADWENLNDYTSKVESETWFHYTELLDEHMTGFRNWHLDQQKKGKDQDKTKAG